MVMRSLVERGRAMLASLFILGAALLTVPPVLAQDAGATAADAAAGVPSDMLPRDLSVGTMFHNADTVVKAVLVGLVLASVATWTVLLAKGAGLLRAQRSVRPALEEAEAQETIGQLQARLGDGANGGIPAAMVAAAAREMALSKGRDAAATTERVASRLARLEAAAGRRIGRGIGLLATIGATAPFVGLFGTVWGIMNSFIGISHSHTTNLAVVAPGIAEALLATAAGLAAAIPAVVIYNLFTRGIGGYRGSLADLSAAILRLVSRELDPPAGARTAAE